nr:late embryogenesis abundant protein LEA37 [Pinus tabuliformis]
MSEKGGAKDCGKHGVVKSHSHDHSHVSFFPKGKHFRRWMGCLIVLIVIVLLVVLFVYIALQPQKPRFNVQDATVRQLNLTYGLLTSSLLFSIESYNPNNNIGIYYDSLSVYASFEDQQITPPCTLTPFYQGAHDNNILPPVLSGNSVALAPFVASQLSSEMQSGLLTWSLTTYGRIRFKVGTWTSGHYHLNVNCVAVMGLNNNGAGGQVSMQRGTNCKVDIGG